MIGGGGAEPPNFAGKGNFCEGGKWEFLPKFPPQIPLEWDYSLKTPFQPQILAGTERKKKEKFRDLGFFGGKITPKIFPKTEKFGKKEKKEENPRDPLAAFIGISPNFPNFLGAFSHLLGAFPSSNPLLPQNPGGENS